MVFTLQAFVPPIIDPELLIRILHRVKMPVFTSVALIAQVRLATSLSEHAATAKLVLLTKNAKPIECISRTFGVIILGTVFR